MLGYSFRSVCLLVSTLMATSAFAPSWKQVHHRPWGIPVTTTTTATTPSNNNIKVKPLFFFDKVFEEEGVLGKGITVGKIQIALMASDRSRDSIFGDLERKARSTGDSSAHLAMLAKEVSLALLRRSDDWIAASSDSKWFKYDDAGKAEGLFNDWANAEAVKFEKEYIPSTDADEKGGGTTVVVVSLIIEIEGDETKFDGAGFSLTETKEVLTSIASDVTVADGEVVNAVEVFWTPSDREEVLTTRDIIADFPELVTL